MANSLENIRPDLFPSVRSRVDQAQLLRREVTSGTKEADQNLWQSFQKAGLDVEFLKSMEEDSANISLPQIKSPELSAEKFKARSEHLERTLPQGQILKAKEVPHLSPPKVPPDVVFPGGPAFAKTLSVQGSGLGWTDSDSKSETWIGQWPFQFTPPQDGMYSLTCFPALSGTIWGHANDLWWNSKDFRIQLNVALAYGPGVNAKAVETTLPYWLADSTYTPGLNEVLLSIDHGHFTLAPTSVNFPEELNVQLFLQANTPVSFGTVLTSSVYAQGAGAYAGFNLTGGVLIAAWELLS